MNQLADRKFQKGVSGNPGGRPKEIAHVRELARARTAEAIKTLIEIAQSKKASDAARVSAACALLDRAWGKPTQAIEHSGPEGGPIETTITPLDFARRAAYLLAAAEAILKKQEKDKL